MSSVDPENWFDIRQFDNGVVGSGEPGHEENVKSFLVQGSDLALLFDTGMGIGNIKRVVDRLVSTPVLVVNSHAHWDHVGDDWRFERIWIHNREADDLRSGTGNERTRRFLAPGRFAAGVPEWIDPTTFAIEGVEPERELHGGELIDLGGRELLVVETPGHSPGGITLVEEQTGIALVGDAVYAGALYAHLEGSDPTAYRDTLRRLGEMASSLDVIYPSHNAYPLDAAFLVEVRDAYESIWEGRVPDAEDDGAVRHEFGTFSVLLRADWRP